MIIPDGRAVKAANGRKNAIGYLFGALFSRSREWRRTRTRATCSVRRSDALICTKVEAVDDHKVGNAVPREFFDIALSYGPFRRLSVMFVQSVETVHPSRGLRRVPHGHLGDQFVPEKVVAELIDQNMRQSAFLELRCGGIDIFTRVMAHQTVKAFALRQTIELLYERAVPLTSPVRFPPMSGQDHVGNVQDVQQVAVFVRGEFDVRGE